MFILLTVTYMYIQTEQVYTYLGGEMLHPKNYVLLFQKISESNEIAFLCANFAFNFRIHSEHNHDKMTIWKVGLILC